MYLATIWLLLLGRGRGVLRLGTKSSVVGSVAGLGLPENVHCFIALAVTTLLLPGLLLLRGAFLLFSWRCVSSRGRENGIPSQEGMTKEEETKAGKGAAERADTRQPNKRTTKHRF